MEVYLEFISSKLWEWRIQPWKGHDNDCNNEDDSNNKNNDRNYKNDDTVGIMQMILIAMIRWMTVTMVFPLIYFHWNVQIFSLALTFNEGLAFFLDVHLLQQVGWVGWHQVHMWALMAPTSATRNHGGWRMINGAARNSRSCSYWEHDNDWYTKESAKFQAPSLLLTPILLVFLFAALVGCLLHWIDMWATSYRWSCFFIMTRPGGKAGKWLSDSQLWTLLLFKGVRQHSVCESGMRQFGLFTFSEYGDFGWAGLRTQTQVEVNLCMFHPCRHADANVEVSPTEKIEEVEEKGTDKGGWQLTHVKEENQDRQWSTRNDAV